MDIHALIERVQAQQPALLKRGPVEARPLTGGVSCEIYLIDDGEHRLVLKRALAKLNVKDDWFADVGRNRTEQQYLRYVGEFLPDSVPKVLYSDDDLGFFCMEMVEGDLQNWKQLLLDGVYSAAQAEQAGRVLGQIHRQSVNNPVLAKTFATHENFYALRLDPYLVTTGLRHPALQKYFQVAVDRISSSHRCLIHGDYSPKNILLSDSRLVVLDCEVACYGDPVFDLAFLLNHFFLKSARKPTDAQPLLAMANRVWRSYRQAAGSVVDADFEQQLASLIPLLMLARVDGKSPVEYLTEHQQNTIRHFVAQILPTSPRCLTALSQTWDATLEEENCCENS